MVRSIQLPVAALALLLPLACSSAGGQARVEPATPVVELSRAASAAAPAPSANAAPVTSQAALPAPSDGAAPQPPASAAAPLAVINQLVTTQALLVSLLLAPVSSQAARAPAPARAN